VFEIVGREEELGSLYAVIGGAGGRLAALVFEGVFTLDQEGCESATYSPGEVVVEPIERVHRVRNLGTTDLEFWVTFLDVPVGSPQRLEPETDPGWIEPAC
jgi:quercetin dioxygenase-like cupin family protein